MNLTLSLVKKAHNKTIKFVPCGCRTLVPRTFYGGRYVLDGGFINLI